jgi:hypothetical protein
MKGIKATGERYWGDDTYLQQVQCECGEVFEAWLEKDAKAKFNQHECEVLATCNNPSTDNKTK